MSLFKKGHRDDVPDDAEIERRFGELALATPELGGVGPRDWSPAEDTEGFVQPDPPLPHLRPSTVRGWVLLVISLMGLCVLGFARPAFSAVIACVCLLILLWSLYLLIIKK